MSYRVLTGPAIPFVHALPSGLGADPETAYSGPWWGQAIQKFIDPLGGAVAQRVAYGKTDPYYSPYGYGSTPPLYYGQGSPLGSFGGISPTMLLVGGAALLAVMMLGRK